jgi:hypothetical protein
MAKSKGNVTYGLGGSVRTKGEKMALAIDVLGDLRSVWNEPALIGDKPMIDAQGEVVTRGKAALRIMSKSHPDKFVKVYASVMPHEIWTDSNLGRLSDEEITLIIENIREQISARRAEPIDVTPKKVLIDAE